MDTFDDFALLFGDFDSNGTSDIPPAVCCHFDKAWIVGDVVTAVYNGVIALMNIFHLVVLCKVKTLRGTANFKILVAMAINDIEFGVFTMVDLLGLMRGNDNSQGLSELIILSITSRTAHNMKIVILACAAYDRYKAICDPYFHASSFFLRNIAVMLVLGDLLSMAVNAPLTYSAASIANAVHPDVRFESYYGYVYIIGFFGVPLAVTIILSGFVLKELHRMSKRVMSQEDKAIRSSALYVLAVIGVLVVSIIPKFVHDAATHIERRYASFAVIFDILCYSYGLMNILIYGILNPAYRREVLKIIRWRRTAVQPLN